VGSKRRFMVVLSESELDMARRMNVTAEQYAIEVVRKEHEESSHERSEPSDAFCT
jgi:hypothetical protein